MAKNKENQTPAPEIPPATSSAPAAATMSGETGSPDAASSLEGGLQPASADGYKEAGTTPAPASASEQNDQTGPVEAVPMFPAPEEPVLYSLEELAQAKRVPSWQSAALHRLMGWEPGKHVSEAEYMAGLARLKNRRIGG
jgi:hypothetical protein